MKTSQDTSAVRYDSYWSGVLRACYDFLKISLCFSRIFFKCSKNSIGPKQHRIRMNSPGNLVVNFRIIKAFNAAIKANLCVQLYVSRGYETLQKIHNRPIAFSKSSLGSDS